MPIRILQVVNSMNHAGLETMLMNYYRNIDRNRIQFDFLTHRDFVGDYDSEILEMGGHIYHAPRLYPQNYVKYFHFMRDFFAEHPEYKIVHSHIDSMSYLPLLAAKKAGVPIRIAHSHNTSIDLDYKFILKELFRYKIVNVANEFCACGQEAGKYLFRDKRKFIYIPNAIDKNNFVYNPNIRRKIRKQLSLNGKLVIGNVGRLVNQKNQSFLIDILNILIRNDINSHLIIVGVGKKEKRLKEKVEKLNLKKYVSFLGNRNDVNELYQAMDVFVMPSLYEGIPVVGIEAQFSGLPCIFSENIPKEVAFSKNSEFISLKSSKYDWAKLIYKSANNSESREILKLNNNDYDISKSYRILENFYLNLSRKCE